MKEEILDNPLYQEMKKKLEALVLYKDFANSLHIAGLIPAHLYPSFKKVADEESRVAAATTSAAIIMMEAERWKTDPMSMLKGNTVINGVIHPFGAEVSRRMDLHERVIRKVVHPVEMDEAGIPKTAAITVRLKDKDGENYDVTFSYTQEMMINDELLPPYYRPRKAEGGEFLPYGYIDNKWQVVHIRKHIYDHVRWKMLSRFCRIYIPDVPAAAEDYIEVEREGTTPSRMLPAAEQGSIEKLKSLPPEQQKTYISQVFASSSMEFQEVANNILETIQDQERQNADVVDSEPEEEVIQVGDSSRDITGTPDPEDIKMMVSDKETHYENMLEMRDDVEEEEEVDGEPQPPITQEDIRKKMIEEDLFGWMTEKEREYWYDFPMGDVNNYDDYLEKMLGRIDTRKEARQLASASDKKQGPGWTSIYVGLIEKSKREGIGGIKKVQELAKVPYMGYDGRSIDNKYQIKK